MKKIITFIFNITTLKEENFRGLLPNSRKFIPAKKKNSVDRESLFPRKMSIYFSKFFRIQ